MSFTIPATLQNLPVKQTHHVKLHSAFAKYASVILLPPHREENIFVSVRCYRKRYYYMLKFHLQVKDVVRLVFKISVTAIFAEVT